MKNLGCNLTLNTTFNEVEYFADVARIRHTIANMEKHYKLVDEAIVDKRYGTVNPMYGKIEADGAFGLAYSGGYPEYIYTPFGQVKIDSAEHESKDYDAKNNLFAELQKVFGLVKVESALGINPGEIGTRYAITKLPWKANQKFPAAYKRATRYSTGVHSQATILRHLDNVYEIVNERFKVKGQSEFIIEEPKKKSILKAAFQKINAITSTMEDVML